MNYAERYRRTEAASVRQHAGVGDQDPRCQDCMADPLPCLDCLQEGGA
jgi:hypothetical protein